MYLQHQATKIFSLCGDGLENRLENEIRVRERVCVFVCGGEGRAHRVCVFQHKRGENNSVCSWVRVCACVHRLVGEISYIMNCYTCR